MGSSLGRVIAIANQKGGVGKTTTAINLGAALALAGHPTLLIDLDPQGNTSSGVGIDKNHVDVTVYQCLLGLQPAEKAIVPTQLSNLYLFPATVDLIGAEIELVFLEEREKRLCRALNGVHDRFEYVLIDSPPSLGLLTLNALTAANGVLIPLQCEFFALEGLTQLLRTIRRIKQNLNPDLSIEGVLLTMFDARTLLSQQVADEVRRHFEGTVFTTVIPRTVRLSEAPSHGLPILLYDPRSRGAQAYRTLAEELLDHATQGSR